MKIVNIYSFNGGESFIQSKHPKEYQNILDAMNNLDATHCLTKESEEKTKKGKLIFSPTDINNNIKTTLHKEGWTEKSTYKKAKKIFKEPRHYFEKGRYREMDGIKNKVGLEIQFGKYSFMGYDIFSKMVIFNKLGLIECGIEIVPSQDLVKQMSSGVSSFEQLKIDMENRGISNIDIPVLIIGIGLTDSELKECEILRNKFDSGFKKGLQLRKYNGSRPGPKK